LVHADSLVQCLREIGPERGEGERENLGFFVCQGEEEEGERLLRPAPARCQKGVKYLKKKQHLLRIKISRDGGKERRNQGGPQKGEREDDSPGVLSTCKAELLRGISARKRDSLPKKGGKRACTYFSGEREVRKR